MDEQFSKANGNASSTWLLDTSPNLEHLRSEIPPVSAILPLERVDLSFYLCRWSMRMKPSSMATLRTYTMCF